MPFVIKARKVNDPVLRAPTARLNKYEQEIFNIYNQALNNIPKDLDNNTVLRALREAVEAGNPMDGAIAFQWQNFVGALDKTIPKLTQQLVASANISAASLPKRIKITSSFTAQDPRAIAWAQQRAGAMILGITQESQKAVAEIITRSLKTQLKREEVIDRISKVVGLDVKQARALGNFYEKNLNDLLEEGLTYEDAVRQVTKLSKAYRQRLLIQRATRIARTETVAAANAGRMLSWAEADAQGFLPVGSEKRYKTAQDERTCSICGPLHNLTIPWESTFPTGDLMPPTHPNCRCTAVIVPADPVFEKVVEKRYYRFADGEETWRNYDYRWRKIANEMKRRIGKCQRCGSKSDLTVDHKKRLKDGGAKYDPKNLRVLCRSCNGKLARLGTKLRKSNNSWLFTKHAPGKHDQQSHAGGGSKVYQDLGDWQDDVEPRTDEDEELFKYRWNTITRSQKKSATEENKKIMQKYSDNGMEMNTYIRSGVPVDSFKEDIENLDKLISATPKTGGFTVYRGVKNINDQDSGNPFRQLNQGDIFQDSAFVSTTLDPMVALQMGGLSGIIFKIEVPPNTAGIFPNSFLGEKNTFSHEMEFLLPRMAKFEVMSGEGKVWEMRVVNE